MGKRRCLQAFPAPTTDWLSTNRSLFHQITYTQTARTWWKRGGQPTRLGLPFLLKADQWGSKKASGASFRMRRPRLTLDRLPPAAS